jgi:glycosyltransferase involved in cell wall biosynthesis
VLADGLRQRGWQVEVCGHSARPAPDRFDLIHVHHFGRAALRLAGTARRSPFVFTTHDPFAMNGLPVGWKRRLTDGFVLRKTDALVALSNTERDFWIRKGIPPARIAVIPNGIDTAIFDHQPIQSDTGPLLLFVGQLRQFKGLDYLLAAMPDVRAVYPQVTLRVVYQTSALLTRYQAQSAALGLNGSVDFAGPRTAAGLARLYSTADVVVSPSLGECLSTVVLEAMCCAAPVVATDVGGIHEQLDQDTGVIVPPRDPAALARAICGLLADANRRRALGDAARRKARAQFSVRRMIDRHVRLYEELLRTNERAA